MNKWRYVELVQTGKTWGLRLPVTGNDPGQLAMAAAGMPGQKTSGLSKSKAVEVGERLEKWRREQEERRKPRK